MAKETIYEKISDTEFKEIIAVAPVENTGTLDDLIANEKDIIDGISNNENQVIFLNQELVKIRAKITKVRALGVKTEQEIADEEEHNNEEEE